MRTFARLVLLVALAAAVVSGCGDDGLLSGLGDRSQDFVYGSTTTTTTVIVVDEVRTVGVVSVLDVAWFNDGIENQALGPPGYVASLVWGRRVGNDRFIQASRVEIASALPNVVFPELVPEEVGWVTSQLVYDTASATLDADVAAAFGLWAVEPYTADNGSVAVLRVGIGRDDTPAERSTIVVDAVESGISLSWTEAGYRYELFCRTALPVEVCEEMARTTAPLRLLLPPDAPDIVEAGSQSG